MSAQALPTPRLVVRWVVWEHETYQQARVIPRVLDGGRVKLQHVRLEGRRVGAMQCSGMEAEADKQLASASGSHEPWPTALASEERGVLCCG